jgi:DNA-binding beta-propeller fold protein YncE
MDTLQTTTTLPTTTEATTTTLPTTTEATTTQNNSQLPSECHVDISKYGNYYYILNEDTKNLGLLAFILPVINILLGTIYFFARKYKWVSISFFLINLVLLIPSIVGLGIAANQMLNYTNLNKKLVIYKSNSINGCVINIQDSGENNGYYYISNKNSIEFQIFTIIMMLIIYIILFIIFLIIFIKLLL